MFKVREMVRINAGGSWKSHFGILCQQLEGIKGKKYPAWFVKVGCAEDRHVDGKYIFLGEACFEKMS